ncbi:MAG: transporter related protein [Ilumatobacteraceae bacterium]|nr:transporter related protein [Ilumatobacteraceae bacterium]
MIATTSESPAPTVVDLDNDDDAITTYGLTKRFGSVAVVDHLDLRVPTGSVFGFLGPNGSGKTTTIRMLLGLISANEGSIELFGQPMPEAAATALPFVGALVEGPACYPWLTGRQNLERIDAAGPDGQSRTRDARIETALERVGLSAAQNKKFKAYSLGMRQRLGLAQALLRPRRMLILDEPTNGMDPQGTREIRHLIRELAADGTTVFLSSHLLAEIEQVCTHVAMMSLGKLVTQGSLSALQNLTSPKIHVHTADAELAVSILFEMGLTAQASEGVVVTDIGDVQPEGVCERLVQGVVGVSQFVVHRPSLEDIFVQMTGEGFDVAR